MNKRSQLVEEEKASPSDWMDYVYFLSNLGYLARGRAQTVAQKEEPTFYFKKSGYVKKQ